MGVSARLPQIFHASSTRLLSRLPRVYGDCGTSSANPCHSCDVSNDSGRSFHVQSSSEGPSWQGCSHKTPGSHKILLRRVFLEGLATENTPPRLPKGLPKASQEALQGLFLNAFCALKRNMQFCENCHHSQTKTCFLRFGRIKKCRRNRPWDILGGSFALRHSKLCPKTHPQMPQAFPQASQKHPMASKEHPTRPQESPKGSPEASGRPSGASPKAFHLTPTRHYCRSCVTYVYLSPYAHAHSI